MAPPVWTLVLLVGAAWGQGHTPAHLRREKPLDQKLVVHSSGDDGELETRGAKISSPSSEPTFCHQNANVLTQCDFEDDTKPLCDWSQVSADDGDWVRASRPSPAGTTGPPGGYPNGEGSYLHMESNNFYRGGVARLRSPDLWEQGPLCVRFAYRMFGLSWGAQLRLLQLLGEHGHRPHVLWKHRNTQRPSWMPTSVTVPAGFTLPTRLMFEGTRGSTAYLDIALDTISIHRGSCNRVCVMQTCSFDIPNDLCGWTWIPTASGAKWTQKKGPSGKPGVGPDGDFSSPGRSIRKHTLFSGHPGPNWQAVSVSYTTVGRIQFIVVGVFGKIPEPAVAVDAISIAPCGGESGPWEARISRNLGWVGGGLESVTQLAQISYFDPPEGFPQCDFEDSAHPFCDWVQTSRDGGHWVLRHKNISIHGMGPSGDFPSAGKEIEEDSRQGID
ncbi:hypothetical protein P7K49_004109 [Saguinus oedipus]|uniref:MAM domain-containing protein n=1 Tax=Saguinus oedipus TaxID=9490 RepID=A0ABQ9W6H3_SAGOE|nr:hypothetical protein P7K49_004109 [Saguinus oedipus]